MADTAGLAACGCDDPVQVKPRMSVHDAVCRAHALVTKPAEFELIELGGAGNRTLSKDLHAPAPMPFFNNSAMDGFAVRTSCFTGNGPWKLPVTGPLAAGPRPVPSVAETPVAVRIFTGAPVPEGFDAVVMQEDVGMDASHAVFMRKPVAGQNVRQQGEDISRGALLVRAGTRLGPRHIGLLAANGYCAVNAYRRPRVGVFSTGDEVIEAGQSMSVGQLFDANRPMLIRLARQAGADVTDLGIIGDTLDATTSCFARMAGKFDLIVSSGAVSVGGHDFIRPALEKAGGEVAFWQVAMKPGKPVMFGKLGDTVVAGLPGNSLAAYVGFKLFIDGMVARLSGRQDHVHLTTTPAIAGFDWNRWPGRTEYFPVRRAGTDRFGVPVIERLGRGGSASLAPLCHADGIAVVAADIDTVAAGDMLSWHELSDSD
ncbi:molybdopterin-binding protein [Anderseniella sp. Alg231-50]|uniref:molybdopterin-binding protein n=1 Tax=Anderseniella sp. Alg231-50 TaxID=1922226 RepID=UPI000D54DE4A